MYFDINNLKKYINTGVYILYGKKYLPIKVQIKKFQLLISEQILIISVLCSIKNSNTIIFKNVNELFSSKEEAITYRQNYKKEILNYYFSICKANFDGLNNQQNIYENEILNELNISNNELKLELYEFITNKLNSYNNNYIKKLKNFILDN